MATSRPTLAVTASRVRLEERLNFSALERRGVPFDQVDTRQLYVLLDRPPGPHLGVLNREISHTRSLYAARMFEATTAIQEAMTAVEPGITREQVPAARVRGVPA